MPTRPRGHGTRGQKASRRTSPRGGPLRRYLSSLGAGLVTGASDDDPSGIATYAQAGARYQLGLLWTALLTLPLMSAVQEICDRTALATGKTLGELAASRFSRGGRIVVGVLIAALIAANALNIAADLAAVGAGVELLLPGQNVWAVVAGLGLTALVVFGSFSIVAQVFKVLTIALLAYVIVVFLLHPDWPVVAVSTFAPQLRPSQGYVAMLVAILGTTISPYLFFWQSAHRVEERRDENTRGSSAVPLKTASPILEAKTLRKDRRDVLTGMVLSNVVMWAIILSTALTIGASGGANIQTAEQAAAALAPLAGRSASIIFALGFIGSGLLAVPILAASGAVGLSGLLHKRWGFERTPHQAPFFYVMVAIGLVGGTVLTVLPVNVIRLLVISAFVNGLAAAPFLILVMLISSDSKLMGREANGPLASVLGWGTAALMATGVVVLLGRYLSRAL